MLPRRSVDRVSGNDPLWDTVGLFEPVRAAMCDAASARALAALTGALRDSRHPADFRRWLREAIARAECADLPLLYAYQRYFEQQAGSEGLSLAGSARG